jgi:hypothetical protein
MRILDLASHQIITLPSEYWSPCWSPNGRFIAGLAHSTDDLSVFDLKTQRWSILQKGGLYHPTWSQDGQFIYFLRVTSDPGLFRIRSMGGKAERVVDLNGLHFTSVIGDWMGLDPGDAPMLLRDAGGIDIYALTLERK